MEAVAGECLGVHAAGADRLCPSGELSWHGSLGIEQTLNSRSTSADV